MKMLKSLVSTAHFMMCGWLSTYFNISATKAALLTKILNDSSSLLILEDDNDRVNEFRRVFKNKHLCIAFNVDNALILASKYPFDIIFIDHDLNGAAFTKSDDNSGAHLARNLKDTINSDTFCIIHSMNPFGSHRILDILSDERAVWCPYNGLIAIGDTLQDE